jgi:hypothetical protein
VFFSYLAPFRVQSAEKNSPKEVGGASDTGRQNGITITTPPNRLVESTT